MLEELFILTVHKINADCAQNDVLETEESECRVGDVSNRMQWIAGSP